MSANGPPPLPIQRIGLGAAESALGVERVRKVCEEDEAISPSDFSLEMRKILKGPSRAELECVLTTQFCAAKLLFVAQMSQSDPYFCTNVLKI